MENVNCNCPHMTCPMHGNCEQCIEFHKGKAYCKVGKVRKAQMRVVFNVYDTVQKMKHKKGSRAKPK